MPGDGKLYDSYQSVNHISWPVERKPDTGDSSSLTIQVCTVPFIKKQPLSLYLIHRVNKELLRRKLGVW